MLSEKRIIPSYRDSDLTVAKRAFGVTAWSKLRNNDLDIYWHTDRSVTDAFRTSELAIDTHPNPPLALEESTLLDEGCLPSHGKSN